MKETDSLIDNPYLYLIKDKEKTIIHIKRRGENFIIIDSIQVFSTNTDSTNIDYKEDLVILNPYWELIDLKAASSMNDSLWEILKKYAQSIITERKFLYNYAYEYFLKNKGLSFKEGVFPKKEKVYFQYWNNLNFSMCRLKKDCSGFYRMERYQFITMFQCEQVKPIMEPYYGSTIIGAEVCLITNKAWYVILRKINIFAKNKESVKNKIYELLTKSLILGN